MTIPQTWAALSESYSWAALPRTDDHDRAPIEEFADMLGLCDELYGVGEWLRFARKIEPGWVRIVPNPDGSEDSWYAECEADEPEAMEAWLWRE